MYSGAIRYHFCFILAFILYSTEDFCESWFSQNYIEIAFSYKVGIYLLEPFARD